MNMFRSAPDTSSRNNAAPHFPIYLLPNLKMPFTRRRQSSAAAIAASNDVPSLSSSPTSTTGTDELPSSPASIPGVETYSLDLPQDKPSSKASRQQKKQQQPKPRRVSEGDRLTRNLPDTLRCSTCGTDVAYGLQIVSKGFTGRHGRALLVSAPPPAATPSCPGPPPLYGGSGTGGGGGNSGSSTPTTTKAANANSYSSLARDGANLVNVAVGRPEPRALVTGAHVVADITCAACGVKIGWKYVDAREQAQKYKVGKFILETERVVLHRSWEDALQQQQQQRRHFYSSSAPTGSSLGGGGGGRKASCSSEGAGVPEEDGEGGSGESEEEEVAFDSDDEDECEDIFAGVWDAATVARRRNSKVGGGGYARAARKKGAAEGGR